MPFPAATVVVGAAAVNTGLAVILAHRGASSSAVLALLPMVVSFFGMLVSSTVLFSSRGPRLSMTVPVLNKPLPLPPGRLYRTDVVVILALVTWLARRLMLPAEARPRSPTTPLLGPPLIFFAV